MAEQERWTITVHSSGKIGVRLADPFLADRIEASALRDALTSAIVATYTMASGDDGE